jgi:O-antigen/teichoic acid export membrane protein
MAQPGRAPPEYRRSVTPSGGAIARASALNLVARTTSGMAALGTAILSTHVLDTHGRGIYAILATFAGIGAVVITGGTTVLAADLIHRRHGQRMLHGAISAIALGSAAILVPLSIAIALLTTGVTLAALLCTAAITVLVTYSGFEMALAQARGDVLRVSLTDIAMQLFPLLVTAVAVLFLEHSVTTLVAAWAGGALITATAQLLVAVRMGSLMIARAWRVAASIMRRSIRVAVANGAGLLCSRIDVLVVAAVLSASAAGVYSIAVALSNNLLLLSRSLLTATYHSIMTTPEQDVATRLGVAIRHSVIVVFAGGAISIVVVKVAAGWVFGTAYGDIWRPYSLLVLAAGCICVVEVLRHYLLTRLERQAEFMVVITAMLVVNAALAAAGAAVFGLIGAAASTTITYALASFVLIAVCSRQLGVAMRELAVPRRSDLIPYWRAARWALRRRRSAPAIAPE